MKKTVEMGAYDAELNTDVVGSDRNIELTLTLRIGFTQLNPANGANDGLHPFDATDRKDQRRIVKWAPGPWAQWTKEFVRTTETYWSDRFCLLNQSRLFAFDEECKYYIPNVDCKLKLELSEGFSCEPHQQVNVIRLHPSESWSPSGIGVLGHDGLFDSLDNKKVRKGTDSEDDAIMQKASVHEVGHMLGMWHVNAGKPCCPLGTRFNAKKCYGITDHELNSVMGAGMQLRSENAQPWRRAMLRFARDEPVRNLLSQTADEANALNLVHVGPRPVMDQWHAHMSMLYPRTPAEVAQGVLRTTPVCQ